MKGVYCIRDERKKYVINSSNDLEKSRMDFLYGRITNNNRYNRILQSKNNLSFLVLKETEEPELDVWDFVLPKLSRVKYSTDVKEALSEKIIKQKYVENVVNYFCTMFPSREYSTVIRMDKENHIIALIVKDGIVEELYGFTNKKEPIFRSIRK